MFGTGPIQGFATTLLIGIATSLFTAIFITRLFIDGYTRNGKPLPCTTSLTKNILTNNTIEFLRKRKVSYVISGFNSSKFRIFSNRWVKSRSRFCWR